MADPNPFAMTMGTINYLPIFILSTIPICSLARE